MFTTLIVMSGNSPVCCYSGPSLHNCVNSVTLKSGLMCISGALQWTGWLGFFITFPLCRWYTHFMIHEGHQWRSETRCNLTPKPGTESRILKCSSSLMCCQHFAVTRRRLIVRTKRLKELERCCLHPCAPTSVNYLTEFLRSWMLKWFHDRVCLYGSWKSR